MDVLSPQLVWIGPRCYRVNGTQTLESHNTQPTESGYVEEDLYSDDEDAAEFKIELTDSNRCKTSYHIPSIFFSQIIGSKGMTKKRIEAETKTQIRIPKPGVEGDVVIVGPNAKSVVSARRKINLIVLAARNKQQFTHFLCIPFTNQKIAESFMRFKNQVLNEGNIDESLFQNPKKLHLTIVALSLMDNEDRAYAAQLLHECHQTIIKPILQECGPLEVHLRGLEYMNDDPGAVDVLYGKVESEPLQMLVNNMANYFTGKGLTQKKTDHVKMHVTLLNSLFRDDQNEQNDYGQQQRRTTFDARWLMERFGNFDFGCFRVTQIHLSQRYSTACDGFYEATATIEF